MRKSLILMLLVATSVVAVTSCKVEGPQDLPKSSASPSDTAATHTQPVNDAIPRSVMTQQHKLESIARQLDPGTPQLVDPDTRLDDVSAGSDGKTLLFEYTLVNPSSVQAAKLDRTLLQRHVKGFMCSNLDKSPVLRDGFVFSYVYADTRGNELARFTLDPNECP
jgi:predicted small lipoprotein YifL